MPDNNDLNKNHEEESEETSINERDPFLIKAAGDDANAPDAGTENKEGIISADTELHVPLTDRGFAINNPHIITITSPITEHDIDGIKEWIAQNKDNLEMKGLLPITGISFQMQKGTALPPIPVILTSAVEDGLASLGEISYLEFSENSLAFSPENRTPLEAFKGTLSHIHTWGGDISLSYRKEGEEVDTNPFLNTHNIHFTVGTTDNNKARIGKDALRGVDAASIQFTGGNSGTIGRNSAAIAPVRTDAGDSAMRSSIKEIPDKVQGTVKAEWHSEYGTAFKALSRMIQRTGLDSTGILGILDGSNPSKDLPEIGEEAFELFISTLGKSEIKINDRKELADLLERTFVRPGLKQDDILHILKTEESPGGNGKHDNEAKERETKIKGQLEGLFKILDGNRHSLEIVKDIDNFLQDNDILRDAIEKKGVIGLFIDTERLATENIIESLSDSLYSFDGEIRPWKSNAEAYKESEGRALDSLQRYHKGTADATKTLREAGRKYEEELRRSGATEGADRKVADIREKIESANKAVMDSRLSDYASRSFDRVLNSSEMGPREVGGVFVQGTGSSFHDGALAGRDMKVAGEAREKWFSRMIFALNARADVQALIARIDAVRNEGTTLTENQAKALSAIESGLKASKDKDGNIQFISSGIEGFENKIDILRLIDINKAKNEFHELQNVWENSIKELAAKDTGKTLDELADEIEHSKEFQDRLNNFKNTMESLDNNVSKMEERLVEILNPEELQNLSNEEYAELGPIIFGEGGAENVDLQGRKPEGLKEDKDWRNNLYLPSKLLQHCDCFHGIKDQNALMIGYGTDIGKGAFGKSGIERIHEVSRGMYNEEFAVATARAKAEVEAIEQAMEQIKSSMGLDSSPIYDAEKFKENITAKISEEKGNENARLFWENVQNTVSALHTQYNKKNSWLLDNPTLEDYISSKSVTGKKLKDDYIFARIAYTEALKKKDIGEDEKNRLENAMKDAEKIYSDFKRNQCRSTIDTLAIYGSKIGSISGCFDMKGRNVFENGDKDMFIMGRTGGAMDVTSEALKNRAFDKSRGCWLRLGNIAGDFAEGTFDFLANYRHMTLSESAAQCVAASLVCIGCTVRFAFRKALHLKRKNDIEKAAAWEYASRELKSGNVEQKSKDSSNGFRFKDKTVEDNAARTGVKTEKDGRLFSVDLDIATGGRIHGTKTFNIVRMNEYAKKNIKPLYVQNAEDTKRKEQLYKASEAGKKGQRMRKANERKQKLFGYKDERSLLM